MEGKREFGCRGRTHGHIVFSMLVVLSRVDIGDLGEKGLLVVVAERASERVNKQTNDSLMKRLACNNSYRLPLFCFGRED